MMLSRFEDGTGGGSGQEAGQPLFQDALQVVMHPEELHSFLGALTAREGRLTGLEAGSQHILS